MLEINSKMPFNKILIALDYDNHAQKIAEIGYAMAKAMGAEVVLLHVLVDATYYSAVEYSPMLGLGGYGGANFSTIAEEKGFERAAFDFLENVRNHLGDPAIDIKVGEGEFADIILNRADNYKADLIVVGSHKKGWFEKMIVGNVAGHVFQETQIPLLIIPIKD